MSNMIISSVRNNTSILISDLHRKIILIINVVFLSGLVSLFGTITNVINMIVFYRQGLDSTTNISFFSLAVSDLCSLMLQQLYNIFVNPLFVNLNLPIVYPEIQFLTTAVPREVFGQITCLITAFITAERCLCVVFPLHVKRIITPKITVIAISFIYSASIINTAPLYCTSYFTWKFHPESNSSLLSLAFTTHHLKVESVLYVEHALLTLLGFLSVVIFTLILIYKLGQTHKWRQTANTDKEKSKKSKRDRGAITMVVVIAGILVVCYTPAVLMIIAMFLEPAFSVKGRHYNLYKILWSLTLFLEVVNSSVNIFLYYKMSSKYRRTCNQLLFSCLQFAKTDSSNENSVLKMIP